jgi:hypothetical protein
MHEAISIPCPRCGAALPVDPMAPFVTCLYCRITAPVPPEIHEAALAHAARMRAAENRVVEAELAIGTYQASAMWSSAGTKVALGMVGAIFGVSILTQLLAQFIRADVISAFSPIAIYGTMGYFGYRGYKAYQAGKKGHAAPLQVGSVCSRCGGPLTFEAGSTRAICHACNGVALAGKTVQLNLAAMAEHRARELDLERARAERQMYRASAPAQKFTRIYFFAVFGFMFAMPILALLIGGTTQTIEGLASRHPKDAQDGLLMLASGATLAALVCGAFAIYYASSVRPQRHAEAELRRIAARLGGQVVRGGTKPAFDWLDAHWLGPAPYELMMAQQEVTRVTLETAVNGAPALVVAIFAGSTMKFSGNKLHLLVAAPRSGAPELPSRAAAEISRLGFAHKVSEDGVALARPDFLPDVMNEQALGWALTEAAVVARG